MMLVGCPKPRGEQFGLRWEGSGDAVVGNGGPGDLTSEGAASGDTKKHSPPLPTFMWMSTGLPLMVMSTCVFGAQGRGAAAGPVSRQEAQSSLGVADVGRMNEKKAGASAAAPPAAATRNRVAAPWTGIWTRQDRPAQCRRPLSAPASPPKHDSRFAPVAE